MQCSTASPLCQPEPWSRPPVGLEKWEDLLQHLPDPGALEASARSAGALRRRREVKTAADLLRLVLGYAVCDWSLRLLGIWSEVRGWGHLSHIALRKRLRGCKPWLGMLIMTLLQSRRLRLSTREEGPRLRIQDATVISRPGSQGTDWRMHLSLDLGQRRIDGVELTDAHGGESLVRFPIQPGEIRLADCGYAHARALGQLLAEGGQVVVRINWQSLRLEERDGSRFDVAAWLGQIRGVTPEHSERGSKGPSAGAQERMVWLLTPQGRFALRLAACPLPPEKAEEARRRAHKASRKKKHTTDARTLLAAGFVLLLTNLPDSRWSTPDVLGLYRFRWQVETLIKRLKSLLAVDGLRAQDPELAQTYLLGKLLGALLLEAMTGRLYRRLPDDWDLQTRPLSHWRITALCQEALKQLIRGDVKLAMLVQSLPRLLRFLSDGPRKRPCQWTAAQHLLHVLSGA